MRRAGNYPVKASGRAKRVVDLARQLARAAYEGAARYNEGRSSLYMALEFFPTAEEWNDEVSLREKESRVKSASAPKRSGAVRGRQSSAVVR